ncbi:glycoside hydrolase superfamily [Talaromyces proteolyticus]|uniref:Beta-mannosidase A n=1 Tax=Talaromyces proteolyticus TaxID=1131652 RepID=A0AAD4KM82_9EURO|nr:glycoside hydrolase superfamily [Talaromyces proteolyticus]KAH8696012.1 glycoside hydrolase superfamily [Talaromyces proteolyticus]
MWLPHLYLAYLIGLSATLCTSKFTAISSGAEYLDIGGKWSVRNANGSVNIPATVPGLIQTDLEAAGWPSLLSGDNCKLLEILNVGNFEYRELIEQCVISVDYYNWVPLDNWTFSYTLPAKSHHGTKWSAFKKVYLVFEGIDTVANIRLGNETVGYANNQFRQWSFDVTSVFKSSTSDIELSVEIISPVQYMFDIFQSTGSPWTEFTNYATMYPEGREYIRKVQSDFGWDWGPHFAPQGIYRDAYLVGLDDGVYVTNTFIDIFKVGQRPNTIPDQSASWVVNVSVDYLSANENTSIALDVDIADHKGHADDKVNEGFSSITLSFNINEGAIERWWPASFGNPTLYNASISLTPLNEPKNMKRPIKAAKYTKQTGFRTIVLDLTPYTDRPGNHFSFQINGHVFNAKGSNLVPLDPFEPRVNTEQIRRLFQSSLGANMNLLRVWSSGNYYADEFYDAADEMGLLLWSEFEFSDNYYPVFSEFLDNVRHEVVYQMRRLNRHPALAVWCGGNELDGYVENALKDNATYGQSWFSNFTILEGETIWPLVYQNTRSLSWLQSSSSLGYISYNPETGVWIPRYGNNSPYYGPAENYNLKWQDGSLFNNSQIPATRFAVEFGALSYDSLEGYRTILPDSEIRPNGSGLMARCYDGGSTTYADLLGGIQRYYIYPNLTDPIKQFDQFSWTSQVYQAEIMKHQIESYRRGIGQEENNLGQLFWQLNAPWTTLQLSAIEYTGRWKVLQHVAKQTYEPVIVSSWFEPLNDTFNIWVASDAWEPVTGEVIATWYQWSGEKLASSTYRFALNALDSKSVVQLTGWRSILPAKGTNTTSILLLKLNATSQSTLKTFTSENFWVPRYLSNATIVDPGLEIQYTGQLTWRVRATKGVAAYVWLTDPNISNEQKLQAGLAGYFSDNAVFMAKGEEREFTYTLLEGAEIPDDAWAQKVTVRSFWNNIAN